MATCEAAIILSMAFSFIKKEMDYNQSLYEAKVETNRENGRKGGAPAGNSNARASQGEAAQGNPEQPKTTETTQNNPKQPKQPKTTQNNRKQPKQPYMIIIMIMIIIMSLLT